MRSNAARRSRDMMVIEPVTIEAEPARPARSENEKIEDFRRVSRQRVEKAAYIIRSIGAMGRGGNYVIRSADVDKIEEMLSTEVDHAMAALRGEKATILSFDAL